MDFASAPIIDTFSKAESPAKKRRLSKPNIDVEDEVAKLLQERDERAGGLYMEYFNRAHEAMALNDYLKANEMAMHYLSFPLLTHYQRAKGYLLMATIYIIASDTRVFDVTRTTSLGFSECRAAKSVASEEGVTKEDIDEVFRELGDVLRVALEAEREANDESNRDEDDELEDHKEDDHKCGDHHSDEEKEPEPEPEEKNTDENGEDGASDESVVIIV